MLISDSGSKIFVNACNKESICTQSVSGDAERLLQQLIKHPTSLLWIRPTSRPNVAQATGYQQAVLHQIHHNRYFVVDTAVNDKFWELEPIQKLESILGTNWNTAIYAACQFHPGNVSTHCVAFKVVSNLNVQTLQTKGCFHGAESSVASWQKYRRALRRVYLNSVAKKLAEWCKFQLALFSSIKQVHFATDEFTDVADEGIGEPALRCPLSALWAVRL
jgi:hypothetical protein